MRAILFFFATFGLCLGQGPDPETITKLGNCECTSTCRASSDDGFVKDWCLTDRGCGLHDEAKGGSYDYCQYLDTETDFSHMHWHDKHDELWSLITEDSSLGKVANPLTFFTQSPRTTFENEWDVLPAGRRKVFHPNGVVCPIEMEISEESPFDGLLSAGSIVEGIA